MTHREVADLPSDLAVLGDRTRFQLGDPSPSSSVIQMEDYRRPGLPAEAYTRSQYLDQERKTVFTRYWICVGLASDVPNPGDAYPTDIAGMPIVLVRDRLGTLRAFHNICSHRGLQLVAKPCNTRGHIRCPYHSWTYRADGSLKSTPHFGGYYKDSYDGFDRDSKGLQAIRCDQWLDMVFVNLSGDAPPLEDYLQPVRDRWADYDLGLLRRESREVTLQCDANWKLAVENFSESYHLNWVHPALNSCSRMEDHFSFEIRAPHVGQGSLRYRRGQINGKTLPTFPGLGASNKQTVAEYITVFPNLMLGVHPDYFLMFLVNPLSPSKTRERMLFYFVGDEAMTPETETLRHLPIDLWTETNDEDIEMIERMQVGRQSPRFDGGCFSPALEKPVYLFQQAIAQAVDNPS
ncbi:aromatic ring-hydroxylating dioxygenase subunit alpha [Oscillatoria sp. CS-180]|uniref:aromatic ring-hydroxylating oxygenase subunit alpha n=1 Tax=Oscillatoria sp. CS-180 TaxID=3021720 RepID=UPI00232BCD6E|nr:aromatic ring-hydroxylating dioxygenase subunit alpha [Oscillatoria sp. CS-180]MDB9529373.1 aromatic ring-hydroxylating dioxygenase subunit alpha [Oscillatoria sp. CS-180]